MVTSSDTRAMDRAPLVQTEAAEEGRARNDQGKAADNTKLLVRRLLILGVAAFVASLLCGAAALFLARMLRTEAHPPQEAASPADVTRYYSSIQKDGQVYFIFLKVFEMSFGIYHSAVLACPQSGFAPTDNSSLMEKLWRNKPYVKVPKEEWEQMPVMCEIIEYGGNRATAPASGIMYSHTRLHSHKAFMSTRYFPEAWLYLYGTSTHSARETRMLFQEGKLSRHGKYFAGRDYGLISMNCNTFTSEVLVCAYGFSEKKPNLGVSDMMDASCGGTGQSYWRNTAGTASWKLRIGS